MSKMKRNFNFCPRCGDKLPDYPGALSRVDNKTEICSHCGTEEALTEFVQSAGRPTDASRKRMGIK